MLGAQVQSIAAIRDLGRLPACGCKYAIACWVRGSGKKEKNTFEDRLKPLNNQKERRSTQHCPVFCATNTEEELSLAARKTKKEKTKKEKKRRRRKEMK